MTTSRSTLTGPLSLAALAAVTGCGAAPTTSSVSSPPTSTGTTAAAPATETTPMGGASLAEATSIAAGTRIRGTLACDRELWFVGAVAEDGWVFLSGDVACAAPPCHHAQGLEYQYFSADGVAGYSQPTPAGLARHRAGPGWTTAGTELRFRLMCSTPQSPGVRVDLAWEVCPQPDPVDCPARAPGRVDPPRG